MTTDAWALVTGAGRQATTPWALPSGRAVAVVREDDERAAVVLDDGVRVEVDHAERDRAELVLWWRFAPATVLVAPGVPALPLGDAEPLAVVPAAPGAHGEDCPCEREQEQAQWRAWADWDEVALLVDLLAGLPVRSPHWPWRVPEAGMPVWRGRRARSGAAVVELFPRDGAWLDGTGRFDGRPDDKECAVLGGLDVDLPPPAVASAVDLPADAGAG